MKDIQLRSLVSRVVLACMSTIWWNAGYWKLLKSKRRGTLLDVGCGRHGPTTEVIRHLELKATGIDIFEPNVIEARGFYHNTVVGDARGLPFKDNSFDAVTSIEMLEHLDKSDGQKVLSELKRVCRGVLIISTPIGNNGHQDYYGNSHEEHKYIWSVGELREQGLSVRGIGLRGLSGDGWWARTPMFLRPLQYAVCVFTSLFSWFIPRISGGVIAWREMEVAR